MHYSTNNCQQNNIWHIVNTMINLLGFGTFIDHDILDFCHFDPICFLNLV